MSSVDRTKQASLQNNAYSLCIYIYKFMYIYFLAKILRLQFINYFDYIKGAF